MIVSQTIQQHLVLLHHPIHADDELVYLQSLQILPAPRVTVCFFSFDFQLKLFNFLYLVAMPAHGPDRPATPFYSLPRPPTPPRMAPSPCISPLSSVTCKSFLVL